MPETQHLPVIWKYTEDQCDKKEILKQKFIKSIVFIFIPAERGLIGLQIDIFFPHIITAISIAFLIVII